MHWRLLALRVPTRKRKTARRRRPSANLCPTAMSVADAASLRTVAVQLRSLSADEENQPIIAREEGYVRPSVAPLARASRSLPTAAL